MDGQQHSGGHQQAPQRSSCGFRSTGATFAEVANVAAKQWQSGAAWRSRWGVAWPAQPDVAVAALLLPPLLILLGCLHSRLPVTCLARRPCRRLHRRV